MNDLPTSSSSGTDFSCFIHFVAAIYHLSARDQRYLALVLKLKVEDFLIAFNILKRLVVEYEDYHP